MPSSLVEVEEEETEEEEEEEMEVEEEEERDATEEYDVFEKMVEKGEMWRRLGGGGGGGGGSGEGRKVVEAVAAGDADADADANAFVDASCEDDPLCFCGDYQRVTFKVEREYYERGEG